MIRKENGKLGHVWLCTKCGYNEVLSCAGVWHPDNRKPRTGLEDPETES